MRTDAEMEVPVAEVHGEITVEEGDLGGIFEPDSKTAPWTWFENKVKSNGGRNKQRIVVALMRKLSRALWYVARGQAFDARRLCAVG